MNIVILAGSPRRGGNTDRLCDAFSRGAKAVGHRVEKLYVAELRIGGCRGCNYCRTHGEQCVQADDMRRVDEALMRADMVVFASPIYSFGLSAQLKLAMDRMFAHDRESWPIRRAAVLIAYADDEPDVADGALFSLRRFIGYYGWQLDEPVVARAVNAPGDVLRHPEFLEQAEALGRRVC